MSLLAWTLTLPDLCNVHMLITYCTLKHDKTVISIIMCQQRCVCRHNNVVSNSPHPADEVLSDKWDKPYSRELAAYPAAWCRQAKFWPTTSRVDNVYGDKNLVSRLPEASTAFAVAVGE